MSEPSEILRRAAKVLRERAEAATDGPWRVAAEGSEGSRIAPDCEDKRERVRWIANVNGRVQPEDGRNARYMALVDPPVGLALANWLEIVAAWPDEGLGNIPGLDRTNWPDAWQDVSDHALTLARAILREADDA